MLIIGCDLHTRYQVIAMLNSETGELVTRRLQHENGEAGAFYASLPAPAQVGIEATGYTQWFERLMAELRIIAPAIGRGICLEPVTRRSWGA